MMWCDLLCDRFSTPCCCGVRGGSTGLASHSQSRDCRFKRLNLEMCAILFNQFACIFRRDTIISRWSLLPGVCAKET